MELTTRDRFLRMYAHQDADRIPIFDVPWAGTQRRWRREGMPEDADWRDYFDVDKVEEFTVDNSPRYEEKVLEDTPRYQIVTTSWGVTLRNFKEEDSTPEFLDYRVVDEESWADAKARMTTDDDRIPWEWLKANFHRYQEEGRWMTAGFWFGFDVTHSWMMGTENVLCAMLTEPDLITDIFDRYLSCDMALFQKIWDAGYHFDEIRWPDDLGYKGRTFFAPKLYRELVMPFHKKAVDWAHAHGIPARLHSCGDIMTLLPDIVSTGVDGLNPLEIKAGMEPLTIKKEYGDKLLLHGGINAVLWDKPDEIISEMERLIPSLKEKGGYVFASDHSIPNSVSLENFKLIVQKAKQLGSY